MRALLAWINVDLRAIDYNIKQVKRLLKPATKLIAIVKSNAYGHGIFEVALQAIRSGVDMLGVVNASEALLLRKKGIIRPIVVMGAITKEEMLELVKEKVSFLVHSRRSFLDANSVALITRRRVLVHIKLETGINRMGFTFDEALQVIKAIKQRRHLTLEGIWTHLASVEELNKSYTKMQLFQFEKLLNRLSKNGVRINEIPYISTAASAAAMLVLESRYTAVRLGISMYGLWPSRGVAAWAKKDLRGKRRVTLKPALKYRTRLVATRRIPAGSYVGYGCSFQAPKAMTVGVVPVGYAEGIDRSLSNMGFMLLKGAVVSIVGRVCMNMTILDISRRPKSKPGDEVVIIGRSGGKEITATDFADWAGTINYEVVTRIPESIPRIYTK
ncbi:alanine racemase [candidate division Kazan bacterium RBG_13_50_9]|uniref:Alanine racemase n=1 Tax=candidate division Kazan bacterium RBG_13_50_9 TaxID=1798535 RepID=A0A1F4NT80_UNCK3|nr:MAG: alanine racemase [candidate division Kazan bacterium RBG_13_50_9]